MGNIGEEKREIELEPIKVPVTGPKPVTVAQPEPVPA